MQSFEPVLLRSGRSLLLGLPSASPGDCMNLEVFTPQRFTLLARSQNTDAQTIPFNDEGL